MKTTHTRDFCSALKMPKCMDKFCCRVSLKTGCVVVGGYLSVRALLALGALVSLVARGAGHVLGRSVLWGAIFGLLVGPRLIYVTVKKIPRPIKNTAVWLVIYGVVDLAVVLVWRPEGWCGEMLLWAVGLALELCLFVYFALALWSYGVSITSRKLPKREELRMAVLKEYTGVK